MDVQQQTKVAYQQVRRNLLQFFTPDRLVSSIGNEAADQWRSWLPADQRLSPATENRRVVSARMFWRRAVRWRLVDRNPFDGVWGGLQSNAARRRFVERNVVEQVILAAPDDEWRAIIALARFGGLRIPSEMLPLRWRDIDFGKGRVRLTVPKRLHRDGRGERLIPLFSELRPYLWRLFERRTPGPGDYVIATHRLGSSNYRTQFMRILRVAGVAPWPRLFQNLRASRQTEWMQAYDLATVCSWIGNSPEVAARHYAMSPDLNADFHRAAGLEQAQQKAQQSAAVNGGQERPEPSLALKRERRQVDDVTGVVRDWPKLSVLVENLPVGAVGFEPTKA